MTNIAIAFREEITRLARREIRKHVLGLKKASSQSRSVIAELKRRLAKLQAEVAGLERQVPKDNFSKVTADDAEGLRFNAGGLRSHRKRLGISAADYGRLIGISAQTIYAWERGTARPRKTHLAALKALRAVRKREAVARLKRQPASRK